MTSLALLLWITAVILLQIGIGCTKAGLLPHLGQARAGAAEQ